jgi:hypothetical protein
VPDPAKLTLADAFKALTIVQAWGIAVAMVALIVGSISIGAIFQPVVHQWSNRPRTCADMKGYPRGIWITRGVEVLVGAKETTFADELGDFTSPTGGVWYAGEGKQSPDGTYPQRTRKLFSTTEAPSPGQRIVVTWSDPADNKFTANSDLLVSDDGCSMQGPFRNTASNLEGGVVEGFVQYCWSHASQCPPVQQGWRPARLIRQSSPDRPAR